MELAPTLPTQAVVDQTWGYRVLDEVDSTNTYAARLPAWSAIRAKTQTAGRGRTHNRRWVSDVGGMWLSAVLPCPGPRIRWETLPLVAGAAVIDAVSTLGVSGARLRWPNDVMVGRGKLAGLLVERYADDTAVVGIGINVFNQPELGHPELTGQTARLCSLSCGEYSVDDVAATVLCALRKLHATMLDRGFEPIASVLNHAWSKPRRVEVTFNHAPQSRIGTFHGIDARGRLRVTLGAPGPEVYDATEIALLRELEYSNPPLSR